MSMNSEGPYQTAQMRSLIWAFAVRIRHNGLFHSLSCVYFMCGLSCFLVIFSENISLPLTVSDNELLCKGHKVREGLPDVFVTSE